jgi:hypothetical protein
MIIRNRSGKAFLSIFQIFLMISLVFTTSILLSESVEGAGPTDFLLDEAYTDYYDTFPSERIAQTPIAPPKDTITPAGVSASKHSGLSKTLLANEEGMIATSSVPYAHLLDGVQYSLLAVGAIQLIGNLFGLEKGMTNAASIAATAGIMSWEGINALSSKGVISSEGFIGGHAGMWGIGVGVAIFLLTYKDEKTKTVSLECMPWEPPLGGDKCQECNADAMRPCSEYRCKSLGQACELLNVGTEKEECVWVSPKDVKSPTIQMSKEFFPTNLKSIPDTTIRPPNRGVKVISLNKNQCLKAFTPLQFSITLDEPAQCKVDFERGKDFDTMQYFVGESNYYSKNHTQKMSLPSPNTATASPIIQNDGTMNLFIRCRDANGNVNVDDYIVTFCVDKSPDTTPPIISSTSIQNGGAVQYNVDKVDVQVYVNEFAECKWSTEDKAYQNMENNMSCSNQFVKINAEVLYPCSGTLTGVQNMKDNNYFFRCKDQPNEVDSKRNAMAESYKFSLKGSRLLNIIETGPNETIQGGTESVKVILKVETDDGSEEGKAVCYFSPTKTADNYVPMDKSNNYLHEQELNLISGSYKYYFRCIDSGGNVAESETAFNVFVDKSAPLITRVYKDIDALKIVTNEDGSCVYSTIDCNYVFEEGTSLTLVDLEKENEHFVEWKPNEKYYVKCKDKQGNEPSPNKCSMIVNAINLQSI